MISMVDKTVTLSCALENKFDETSIVPNGFSNVDSLGDEDGIVDGLFVESDDVDALNYYFGRDEDLVFCRILWNIK